MTHGQETKRRFGFKIDKGKESSAIITSESIAHAGSAASFLKRFALATTSRTKVLAGVAWARTDEMNSSHTGGMVPLRIRKLSQNHA
jgi:hypothetical protein